MEGEEEKRAKPFPQKRCAVALGAVGSVTPKRRGTPLRHGWCGKGSRHGFLPSTAPAFVSAHPRLIFRPCRLVRNRWRGPLCGSILRLFPFRLLPFSPCAWTGGRREPTWKRRGHHHWCYWRIFVVLHPLPQQRVQFDRQGRHSFPQRLLPPPPSPSRRWVRRHGTPGFVGKTLLPCIPLICTAWEKEFRFFLLLLGPEASASSSFAPFSDDVYGRKTHGTKEGRRAIVFTRRPPHTRGK